MAQQQQSSGNENNHSGHTPSRQSASYPSPSQYPSPSMSGYAYPPPTGQNDSSYRASPTGSNVSLPSLNLPPIRTIDGRQHPPQQAPQQPQGGPPAMPPALPPPMNHQFYPGHTLPPPQHLNITSDPNQPMRYPLPPPPDGRIMSGGRHKKEIKRRTKTGCLTCRKRRIKVGRAFSPRFARFMACGSMSGSFWIFFVGSWRLWKFKLPFYRILEPVCDRLVVARKRVRLHWNHLFTPSLCHPLGSKGHILPSPFIRSFASFIHCSLS